MEKEKSGDLLLSKCEYSKVVTKYAIFSKLGLQQNIAFDNVKTDFKSQIGSGFLHNGHVCHTCYWVLHLDDSALLGINDNLKDSPFIVLDRRNDNVQEVCRDDTDATTVRFGVHLCVMLVDFL